MERSDVFDAMKKLKLYGMRPISALPSRARPRWTPLPRAPGRRAAWPGCRNAMKPPVSYLCTLHDPDGYVVEFSFGQTLGPGARGNLL